VTRLGFAYNPTNESTPELRERAEGWCKVRGIDAWSAQAGEYERLVAELPSTDALVVLGGDGTFLRASRAVAAVDVPILGVAAGKVGFLSKTEPEQLDRTLELVCAGRYTLETRMTIEARILPAGEGSGDVHVALNEAAVVRGAAARVVRMSVAIDDSHLATYIADGLVLATPTGSTAYSFSAGGPILDPTSRNLVVTPIAAYLAAVRSVVVSPRHVVTVRIIDAHDVLVSIDGREDHALHVGDAVQVRAREQPIRFIEPEGSPGFWDLLRRKAELLPS
jgi:NAD+ kinase